MPGARSRSGGSCRSSSSTSSRRGGVPRDQALPSIRELAGFLGINPNTVARAIEDLKRSGHVEARRGKGVFVAAASPPRPSLTRDGFLKDTVIRAAALGMTPDDVAVGVLSLAGLGPALSGGLPRCSSSSAARRSSISSRGSSRLSCRCVWPRCSSRTWRALCGGGAPRPVGRRGDQLRSSPGGGAPAEGLGVPVLALLAEAHLETLQRLAQLPRGARVGVIAAAVETTHTVEHSIAAAALPNIARDRDLPGRGARAQAARGACERHRLLELDRQASPGPRRSGHPRDHRRSGSQSAGHPDAGGRSGAAR